jgi:hypothetical protein
MNRRNQKDRALEATVGSCRLKTPRLIGASRGGRFCTLCHDRARRSRTKHVFDLGNDFLNSSRRLNGHSVSQRWREARDVAVVDLVPHREDHLAVTPADLTGYQSVELPLWPLLPEEARAKDH